MVFVSQGLNPKSKEMTWNQTLAPLVQQVQARAQQNRQREQSIAQGSTLSNALGSLVREKGENITAIDFVKALTQAQAQGVPPEVLEPYTKMIPKLVEQERKGKQFSQEQGMWNDFMARRKGAPSPSLPPVSDVEGIPPEMAKTSERAQTEGTSPTPTAKPSAEPKYASESIDPNLYRKSPQSLMNDVLKAAETGYTHNKQYLERVNTIASGQKEIQRALKEALKGVRSGKVSGFGADIRNRLSKYFPYLQGEDEVAYLNSMKHAALQEFASTPGFRAQSEFQTLLNIYPNIGRGKEAQEYVLESYITASELKEKEAKIINDIINESDIGEVPMNLQSLVEARMQPEWDKAYKKLEADLPVTTVNQADINLAEEQILLDENGEEWAVPNDEVKEYLKKPKWRLKPNA